MRPKDIAASAGGDEAGGTAPPPEAVSAAEAVSAPKAVSAPDAVSAAYGYTADKDALVKRLRRIQGQVGGIEKMVGDDRYCIEILTQIAAVSTALEAVAFKILDEHVKHCVASALASGDEALAAQRSQELLEAVHRFTRAI